MEIVGLFLLLEAYSSKMQGTLTKFEHWKLEVNRVKMKDKQGTPSQCAHVHQQYLVLVKPLKSKGFSKKALLVRSVLTGDNER